MKLTTKALALAESKYLDTDRIIELAKDALTTPSDAYFSDSDLYDTHTLAFSTPDWSLTTEYIDGEANYRDALEILSADYPHDVSAATIGHWTYSRYSCIKIRVVNAKGNIVPSFVAAMALVIGLEAYPLIDDSTYSDLESEIWDASVADQTQSFRGDWKAEHGETIPEWRIERYTQALYERCYEYGGADTGWFNESALNDAADAANAAEEDVQLHQDADLGIWGA